MIKLLIKILDIIASAITYLKNLLFESSDPDVTLISTQYDTKGRYITFTLSNNYLLDNKQILKAIFQILMANDKFINFGNYKIIIVKAVFNLNFSYMRHHNVLLDNNTTFKEYYDKVKVKDHINNNYSNNSTYLTEEIPYFDILVWNVVEYRNKHIKINKSTLSPYKLKKLKISYGLLKSKQQLFKNKLNIREYHNNSSN